MTSLAMALRDPIALPPNRISRFYQGGAQLGRLRGDPAPIDDHRPEDWVGSATTAWTAPGTPPSPLGSSTVHIGGEPMTLADVLQRAPAELVGRTMLDRAGPSLGILVKLLDAGQRLPVHWHPDRSFAARHLASRFGKTEAWLVLATRGDSPARVWAGFREPMEPATWRSWIESQDAGRMLGSLAEYRVVPGDAILIPGGTPHAIDEGCLILELQEPTDFSIVAEHAGFPIDPDDASLRIGWDIAMAALSTTPPASLRQAAEHVSPGVDRLLGAAADPFFRALRQRIDGSGQVPFQESFGVAVVVDGMGTISGQHAGLALRRGTTFALAAAGASRTFLHGDGLEILWCLPPSAEALDRTPLPEVVDA